MSDEKESTTGAGGTQVDAWGRYFFLFVCLVALAHSIFAFLCGDIAYGIGLFGGFVAWALVTVIKFGLTS